MDAENENLSLEGLKNPSKPHKTKQNKPREHSQEIKSKFLKFSGLMERCKYFRDICKLLRFLNTAQV